ncbi:isochorismatase family protein [Rivibacter subsaxonicus]|uniref:Nicotinamidase-related amidase n=1 Tax=Rivibacter subsaxonicus TaxID=457575 RepID=A0A4Q7W2F5_9BURK|nr:isochorismatase family protein [Rivibacter subsaxonicus]RZU02809.1 nicotinamidase-related amidase [Rivibacter subsaxonicus]
MQGTHALLVIDMQRGAFDGEACEPISGAEALLANTHALVDAARAGGVPVLFVQHLENEGVFVAGSARADIHTTLSPAADEPTITKRASSAFEDTDLAARLESLGARELIVSGLQSEFCVFNTARAALELGFVVRIASDAHSTWPSSEKSASAIAARINAELQVRGAVLASTAALVASLRG